MKIRESLSNAFAALIALSVWAFFAYKVLDAQCFEHARVCGFYEYALIPFGTSIILMPAFPFSLLLVGFFITLFEKKY